MESHKSILIVALGVVAFGLYTLLRSLQVARAAEDAWYSFEGRGMKGSARNLGFQAIVLLIAGLSILLWTALNLPEQVQTEPTPFLTATTQPFPTSAASPTIEITPTLATTGTPAAGEGDERILVPIPTPVLGAEAVVADTGGGGLWLRDAPFGNGLALLPEGTIVFVRGGLLEVEGLLWQQVMDAEGREGWVAADYLLPYR